MIILLKTLCRMLLLFSQSSCKFYFWKWEEKLNRLIPMIYWKLSFFIHLVTKLKLFYLFCSFYYPWFRLYWVSLYKAIYF